MNKTLRSRFALKSLIPDKTLLAAVALMLPATGIAASGSFAAKTPVLAHHANLAVGITGVVVDAKGNPIPGVTVKVKNAAAVTVTNANGEFRLNVETGNETLVFSSVGYKTVEARSQAGMRVVLQDDVGRLDDVIVVGYGTVKKRDLTGAVSSVKSEDITVSPVSSPMEALQGRIAGLDIQRTSGQAGSSPNILLRGNRSLIGLSSTGAVQAADQNPLYVIDGVIGNINSLNPNDIESIDVLKDASSTAIYGIAGANGVITITTKKAKAGKVQIDVDSYYGVNGFARYPKALMGDDYVKYINDRYFAGNGKLPASLADAGIPAAAITAIQQGQYIDWVDETLQQGSQQNHHVAVRGGSEKTQGYMSLGYIGEKGIYKGDKSQFYNVRGGFDANFSKFFKAGLQVTANGRNGDQTNSRVNKAYGTYPLGTAYNADGTVNLNPLPGNSTVSPIANYAPGVLVNNTKNLYLAVNPYIELRPIENLSIRSYIGITLSSNRNGYFANERSYNLASEARNTKEASYTTGIGYSYLWENVATYNFKLKEDHAFTLTGITSLEDVRNESSSISGQGLDYNEYLFYNIGALGTVNGRSSSYLQSNRLSFAGRINYSYKGKYLFQASNRYDGVSQLVKKWSSFPSASVAWRISDEDFMKTYNSWLTNLKLRAGYGVAGNGKIPSYSNTTIVSARTSDYNLSLGSTSAQPIYVLGRFLGNPDLTWERAYNLNLGLDFTILKGRLDVTTEWFKTKSTGVIYPRSLPATAGGFDAKTQYIIYANIGETKNTGIEVTLNSRNIATKNFKWNSTLTFTRATEQLTNIDLGNSVTPASLITSLLFVGNQLPQSIAYGYKKIGVWQLGEEAEAAKYNARPGDIKLQTVPRIVNGVSDEGVHPYSTADRMVVGHYTPRFSMGFQNTFSYKAVDLTVFVIARYGQLINAQLLGFYNQLSQPAFYNYWTPTNPTNDFPQPSSGAASGTGAGNNTLNSTYAPSALSFVDGSYLKIKNISLGYTLPAKIASKAGLSRLRIYGTAYNTLIFTKSHLLKDIDPETNGSDSFPLYKQIVFGLNASF